MNKSINDANLLTDALIERLENNTNEAAEIIKSNLSSSKAVLNEIRNFLGSDYELDEDSSRAVTAGKKFDTQLISLNDLNDYKNWAEEFNAAVLNYKIKLKKIQEEKIQEIYQNGQKFLEGSYKRRKIALKCIFISAIIIAIVAAALAIYGIISDKYWASNFAAVLGIIDFTVGIVGFSIERISDMNAQNVSRSLAEIESAKATDNLREASAAATKCQIAIGEGNHQIIINKQKSDGDITNNF